VPIYDGLDEVNGKGAVGGCGYSRKRSHRVGRSKLDTKADALQNRQAA
jgi:hypothetical protein